jgi:hypothetical protein
MSDRTEITSMLSSSPTRKNALVTAVVYMLVVMSMPSNGSIRYSVSFSLMPCLRELKDQI